MPIYEYQCDGCNEVFEVFQKVSDPAPSEHSCGSTKVHRVLSNTSFVLKGTGWYITDYGRKDQGEGGKSKKESDGSKPESKADGGSDSGGGESGKDKSADKPKASSDTTKSPGGGGSKGGGGGAAAA